MVTTALRGLEVLEALAGMGQPVSLRAVAGRMDLSESHTYRVLRALQDEGYVDHVGRAGYRLAARSVALATVMGPRPALVRQVSPVIAQLAHATSEAVVLHLRSGGSRVLVLGVPGRPDDRLDPSQALGERSPLAAGASGRVILAHLAEDELTGLDLGGATAERLAGIRDRGYEMSFGENHPGINGVAAPLLVHPDDVEDRSTAIGSVTIAGPAARLTRSDLEGLVRPLLGAGRRLSGRVATVLGPHPGAALAALDLEEAERSG